jgi:hypothetical protein
MSSQHSSLSADAAPDSELATRWRDRIDVDPATGDHRVRCRADDLPSTAVVLTVSTALGVHPTGLPPLLSAVDPDAVDRLVRHDGAADARAVIDFSYADCRVTVDADGEVVVSPPESD